MKAPQKERLINEGIEDFEKWAAHNIGQFSAAGFHGTNGIWVYHLPFADLTWKCWRAATQTARKQNHV